MRYIRTNFHFSREQIDLIRGESDEKFSFSRRSKSESILCEYVWYNLKVAIVLTGDRRRDSKVNDSWNIQGSSFKLWLLRSILGRVEFVVNVVARVNPS